MKANVNGNRMSQFQNPDMVPLEKLELIVPKEEGYVMIPALSAEWKEERQFLYYEAPRIYDKNEVEIIGAKDRWMEICSFIANDLEWLLRLPFYKFWSNVIFNPSISDSLVTILQEFPTFYNLETFPNDSAMRGLMERIRRNVLVVYARLVTSKESDEAFLSREAHGKFLYEDFLLTVPMMLDICQIYGRENAKVVAKIISTAVKLQPAYNDDFKDTVAFLTKLYKNIEQTFEDRPIPLAASAVPLSERTSSHVLSLENLEDKIIHLLDASSCISIFLDVYPPASELFCNDDFVQEIVHVYGNTIPEMYKRLNTLANRDETLIKYTELKHRLDVTRSEMRKIFRTVTYHNIARILTQSNPSEVADASDHVEQFVNFLEKAVREPEFLIDYEEVYPVQDDLDLVLQISNDVDPVKCDFIKRCVSVECMNANLRKNSQASAANKLMTSIEAGPSGTNQTSNSVIDEPPTNETATKSQVDMDTLIKEVKDILCDLGEGFIERCLKHYNNDSAAVINAVLEDSLPESLKKLDKMLPYIPPDSTEASAAIDQVLGAERLNVFDNDEFDVMTRDNIDKSRVHKGKKKDKYKNLNQLLDDKSYRKEVGNIYEKYSIIQDEYEDEYDDTYESDDVGPREVDEPVDGRAFTTPRILRWNEKRGAGGDEEDDEDPETEASSSRAQNSRENFVQDPAELRARAEQRRLSKRGGGGGSSWKSDRGPDLVGKPKGQGNEKSVLVNRDKKNTHKASRANHNRRSGAEHKRRQGMVPS